MNEDLKNNRTFEVFQKILSHYEMGTLATSLLVWNEKKAERMRWFGAPLPKIRLQSRTCPA